MWKNNDNCRASSRMLLAIAAALFSASYGRTAVAQFTPASAGGPPERKWTVTPAQDARGVQMYQEVGLLTLDGQRRVAPDQVDSVLVQRARQWVTALRERPVTGIQQDPMATLYVATGQDALAKQQFDARLATKGLSLDDRAYTLFLATVTFGENVANSARMRTALDYLAQLDALPTAAARLQYAAHTRISFKYYDAGDAIATIAHQLQAFSRWSYIPWEFLEAPEADFVHLADALSGQPNGRARIDSLAHALLAFLEVPRAVAARDPGAVEYNGKVRRFQEILRFTAYLGRPAPLVPGHYWWNMDAPSTPSQTEPGAMAKSLNDGKVRLLEFGSITCGWCLVALHELESTRAALPSNAEILYVSRGYGNWGADVVPAAEEAEHLKNFYLNVRHDKIPIALWIGERIPDEDGGSLAKPNPFWEAFGIESGPAFIVTDGNGIVRHVSAGYSKGLLAQHHALHFVIAEAEKRKSVTVSPSPVSTR